MAVNSIRDGLNLIAKEYVASRLDEQGVLLLSKNAGCAAELSKGAIVIDPVNADEFADGLAQAFTLEIEEKRRRMTTMRRVVGWNQLHDWAIGFLQEALGSKRAPGQLPLRFN
jgi:trehalose-6-phosphate synthase